MGVDLSKAYFVIWTTTTWTLPGERGDLRRPGLWQYVTGKVRGGRRRDGGTALTRDLPCRQPGKDRLRELLASFKGSELEYMKDGASVSSTGTSLVIVGDHVTLESGTGCVHTAPGLGVEDFDVCHNQLSGSGRSSCRWTTHGRLTAGGGRQFAGRTHRGSEKKAIARRLDSRLGCYRLRQRHTRSRVSAPVVALQEAGAVPALQSSGSARWTPSRIRLMEAINRASSGSRAGGRRTSDLLDGYVTGTTGVSPCQRRLGCADSDLRPQGLRLAAHREGRDARSFRAFP